jgi:glycine cleavage system H lipoate-binding protein
MIMNKKCPFLEELSMVFCNACKTRKMLPKDQLVLQNSCEGNYDSCLIYREFLSSQKKEEKMAPENTQEAETSQKEKPCIWMKAGVIAYRMCTRNYDCKNCEFDKALMEQGGSSSELPMVVQAIEKLRQLPANERKCRYMLTGDFSYKICPNNYECWHCAVDQYIQDTIEANPYLQKRRQRMAQRQKKIRGFTFRDDVYYLPNHIWIAIEGEIVKVGIDDFAARLIGNIKKVDFSENTIISKHEKCWQIGEDKRSIAMSLPFDGEVIEKNEAVEATPSIVHKDPYNRGWLLKLKLSKDLGNMMKGSDAEKWLEKEFEKLHQEIETDAKITISDGGEVIDNISERLNDNEWQKIITRFIW